MEDKWSAPTMLRLRNAVLAANRLEMGWRRLTSDCAAKLGRYGAFAIKYLSHQRWNMPDPLLSMDPSRDCRNSGLSKGDAVPAVCASRRRSRRDSSDSWWMV